MDLTIRPLTPDRWPALEDLFGRSGASSGCWCMYWRIGPANQRRPRALNREALRERVGQGPPPGLLAFDGDRAVGWCQLTPRGELAWLERRREFVPLDDAVAGATTNRFTGTLATFLRAGFVELARRSPARPVLRHDLEGVAA